ncbi:MAG: sucrase ferredoxin [Symploca sp. SIO2C1]|nr:sucrase ferredoxin [Symploca sp. SIO2C1]
MNPFFCAEASRQADEDIIGSGTNYSTYILVECPTPWAANAFDSKSLPNNLKTLVEEVKQSQRSIRFLLLAPNKSQPTNGTKVLIFEQEQGGLSRGYQKHEFNVAQIEQVAGIVEQYLAGESPDCEEETDETRDILVCTHGSHDKCCARYGNPFYREALKIVAELSLSKVRIWQASHFGGHRFAPTAIDFPDGRYYGGLKRDSFISILTRTGDIECLKKVYRGWSILPTSMQVLERELILLSGWDWFHYKVTGRILKQSFNNSFIKAELTFEKPDSSIYTYRAQLVRDENKTMRLRGSCGAMKESEFVKYYVDNLTESSGKPTPFDISKNPDFGTVA